MYRRRLYGILLQALLIFRLSINTIKSLCIAYVVLIVVVSSISTNSIKRFFFALIQLYSSRVYFSAISVMRSTITLSKILLRVFSRAIGRQLSRIKQFTLPSFYKTTVIIDLLSYGQYPIIKYALAISISQGAISSLQVFKALFKIILGPSTILFKRRLIVLAISSIIILLLTYR